MNGVPNTMGGPPADLRITVADVLGYLASEMTYQEILRDFPYLNEDDILAKPCVCRGP
jgi:uncharacterized protein (DUF433 family)